MSFAIYEDVAGHDSFRIGCFLQHERQDGYISVHAGAPEPRKMNLSSVHISRSRSQNRDGEQRWCRSALGCRNYTFTPNLLSEFEIPENGIVSRVLYKDERLNITLFGFSAGQELSTHSAPVPALIHVLQGEAEIDLGDDTVQVEPGSFIRMAPLLSHAVRAKTPFRMLLVQVKNGTQRK